MKKFYLFMLGLMVSGLCFTACSDNDKPTTPPPPTTVDGAKARIEQESIAFLKEMEGLADNEGLQTIGYFSGLFDSDNIGIDITIGGGGSTRASIIRTVELISLSDYYSTQTWNFNTEDWDVSENAEELKFVFPSDDSYYDEEENNASITVTAKDTPLVYEGEDGKKYYVPEKATATLKIGNTIHASLDMNIDWDVQIGGPLEIGVPNLAKVEVKLLPNYNLTINGAKGTPNTGTMVLKNGNTTVINMTGTFDANLQDYVDRNDIEKANADGKIQLLNDLEFVVKMDVKGYSEAETDYSTAQKAAESKRDAFNKYVNVVLRSRVDNADMATVVASRVKKDEWNDYDVVYAFAFADGSTVDVDVYFGTGFEELLNEWNKIFDRD